MAEYSPSGAVGFERSDTSLGKGEEQVTWVIIPNITHSTPPPVAVTGAVVVPQKVQFSKTLPISFP